MRVPARAGGQVRDQRGAWMAGRCLDEAGEVRGDRDDARCHGVHREPEERSGVGVGQRADAEAFGGLHGRARRRHAALPGRHPRPPVDTGRGHAAGTQGLGQAVEVTVGRRVVGLPGGAEHARHGREQHERAQRLAAGGRRQRFRPAGLGREHLFEVGRGEMGEGAVDGDACQVEDAVQRDECASGRDPPGARSGIGHVAGHDRDAHTARGELVDGPLRRGVRARAAHQRDRLRSLTGEDRRGAQTEGTETTGDQHTSLPQRPTRRCLDRCTLDRCEPGETDSVAGQHPPGLVETGIRRLRQRERERRRRPSDVQPDPDQPALRVLGFEGGEHAPQRLPDRSRRPATVAEYGDGDPRRQGPQRRRQGEHSPQCVPGPRGGAEIVEASVHDEVDVVIGGVAGGRVGRCVIGPPADLVAQGLQRIAQRPCVLPSGTEHRNGPRHVRRGRRGRRGRQSRHGLRGPGRPRGGHPGQRVRVRRRTVPQAAFQHGTGSVADPELLGHEQAARLGEHAQVGAFHPDPTVRQRLARPDTHMAPQLLVGPGRTDPGLRPARRSPAREGQPRRRERDRQRRCLPGVIVDHEAGDALEAGVDEARVDLVVGRVVRQHRPGVADQRFLLADPHIGDPAERRPEGVAEVAEVGVECLPGDVTVGRGREGRPLCLRHARGHVDGCRAGEPAGQVLLPRATLDVDKALHAQPRRPDRVRGFAHDDLDVVPLPFGDDERARADQILDRDRLSPAADRGQDRAQVRGRRGHHGAVQAVVGEVRRELTAAIEREHPPGQRRGAQLAAPVRSPVLGGHRPTHGRAGRPPGSLRRARHLRPVTGGREGVVRSSATPPTGGCGYPAPGQILALLVEHSGGGQHNRAVLAAAPQRRHGTTGGSAPGGPDEMAQRPVRPDLQADVDLQDTQLPRALEETHRLAHMPAPVVGVIGIGCGELTGEVGDDRQTRRAEGERRDGRPQRSQHRAHQAGMESMRHDQGSRGDSQFLHPGGETVDLGHRAGHHHRLRPVDCGDVQGSAGEQLGDPFRRCHDGEHPAGFGVLHEPGTMGDQNESGVAIHHAGVDRGRDLSDAVADDHGGGHAPRLPQRRERQLEGDQGGLGDPGGVEQAPVGAAEHQFRQAGAEHRGDYPIAGVDHLAEDRFGLVQLPPHPEVLAALAGEQEGDPRRPGGTGRDRCTQPGEQLVAVTDEQGAPGRQVRPARPRRGREIGTVEIGTVRDVVLPGRREAVQSRLVRRGQREQRRLQHRLRARPAGRVGGRVRRFAGRGFTQDDLGVRTAEAEAGHGRQASARPGAPRG